MAERGQPPPDWYHEQPALLPGDDFYIKAFTLLGSERQVGFGAAPIPWSAMVRYAMYHDLPRPLHPHFVAVLQAMDMVYTTWHAAKAADEEGAE